MNGLPKHIIVIILQKKTPNNKWLINLTEKQIPNDIRYFLSLSRKFYTNNYNKVKLAENILVNIEEKINLIPTENRTELNSNISNRLQNYLNFSYKNNNTLEMNELGKKQNSSSQIIKILS